MANKTILVRVYLFISALIILNICLYVSAKMSLSGYWSDRFLFWLWFLATPFIVVAFWKKIWAKIYFSLLVIGLILTILPMAIPFFGILLSTTGSERLNHFNLKNNIRIQTVGYGVMGRPRLQIVKDGLLFDKIILETGDEISTQDSTWIEVKDVNKPNTIIKSVTPKEERIRDATNAALINQTDTTLTIKYYFNKDSVQVMHHIKGNKPIIY